MYDARESRLVAPLEGRSWGLGPRGDIAVTLDGGAIRVMHACDGRIVELAARAGSAPESSGGWSPDGRYLAVSFGRTDEVTGPESVVIVEPLAGRVAIVNGPWGYIHTWSPDLRYVVLGRRGFHDLDSRLARLTLDGR